MWALWTKRIEIDLLFARWLDVNVLTNAAAAFEKKKKKLLAEEKTQDMLWTRQVANNGVVGCYVADGFDGLSSLRVRWPADASCWHHSIRRETQYTRKKSTEALQQRMTFRHHFRNTYCKKWTFSHRKNHSVQFCWNLNLCGLYRSVAFWISKDSVLVQVINYFDQLNGKILLASQNHQTKKKES